MRSVPSNHLTIFPALSSRAHFDWNCTPYPKYLSSVCKIHFYNDISCGLGLNIKKWLKPHFQKKNTLIPTFVPVPTSICFYIYLYDQFNEVPNCACTFKCGIRILVHFEMPQSMAKVPLPLNHSFYSCGF